MGSPMVRLGEDGLDRARVAELIVTTGEGARRGSGYRIGTGAVLTAANVLDAAVSVQARFEPDLPNEWITDALDWWIDPSSDLAIVSVSPRPEEHPVRPVQFGSIGANPAVLSVQAVGFPWRKMRNRDGSVPRVRGSPGTTRRCSPPRGRRAWRGW